VKLYEAMFLVDSSKAAADWTGIEDAIKHVMGRVEAEIVSMKKWDDRRLAYEVKGCDRGAYILCYFKADGERIRDIERDVQLSEQFMRVLILSAEGRETEVDQETPAMKAERMVQESREAAEAATAAKIAEAAEAASGEEPEDSTSVAPEAVIDEAVSEVAPAISESSETSDASEVVEEVEEPKADAEGAEDTEASVAVDAESEPDQVEDETKKSGDEEVS
jgi:small subunit ribosomal protein S6